MLQNAGNIALQISQILYTFVIRAPLSAQKFTNFKMLFLAVVMDLFFLSFCLDQNLVYSWNHLFDIHFGPSEITLKPYLTMFSEHRGQFLFDLFFRNTFIDIGNQQIHTIILLFRRGGPPYHAAAYEWRGGCR